MSARKAKRHINESQDFICFTLVKNNMYVDYKDTASLNIIGDIAAANKDFKKYLEEVLQAIKNHESTNKTDTDQSSTD